MVELLSNPLTPISIAAAGLACAVRAPWCNWLAPSVHRGDPRRKSLALTFDDGPSESTPELLDLLDRFGVRATFFMCGANVRRLPEIAQEVLIRGHEIGNHTYSHAALYLKSAAFIEREIAAAQQTFEDVLYIRPKYFRAPYGCRWFGLAAAQNHHDLLGVMWTVIGLDWKYLADQVARRVVDRARPGGIICLHDGRGLTINPDIQNTLDALSWALPVLQKQGYKFETVSELLCNNNPT
jgi:peptidoglycan/xylan/chitin deacetylase (PgdA/CDA1 family)